MNDLMENFDVLFPDEREKGETTLRQCQLVMLFEDMEAYIPKNFERYLKRPYGSYMQLPPIEKRVSHHNVIAKPFTPCRP